MEAPIDLDRESDAPNDQERKKKSPQRKRKKPEPEVLDKRTSAAWEPYIDIRDPTTNKIVKAQCKFCDKILSAPTRNGTSALTKHTEKCNDNPKNVDKRQMKISTFRTVQSDATTISNWEFNQTNSRLALAKMIIMDEEPFSKVERDGFRYFCSVAIPHFQIPSRFTVARDLSKVFLSETETLRNHLKNLKSRIALTTDCWTSVQNLNYMCLTAHFIDDCWKLHKRILSFRNIDSHKGKEIGKEVESCILYWGIEDKLSCITVDIESANDVAVAYIKENLTDKLVLGGEFFHMRCATHILNLIVKDGLNMIKDSVNSIRGAIKYFRNSTERSKLFDDCASKEKILCKGSVSLDVATRWNSTYIMLETAIKFEKAFTRMKKEDPEIEKELKDGFPSEKNWVNAKSLSACLKQFFEATKRMSGTLYVTANSHYHEILGVLASLLEWETDPDINIVLMGDQMRKKFDKYYGNFGKTNVMVLVAVALDPRYKMKFVKFSLKKIFPLDFKKVEELYDKLFDSLKRLYNHYASVSSIAKNDGSSSSTSGMNDNGGQNFAGTVKNKQMRKIYDEFYEDDVDAPPEKSELDEYLDAPPEKPNNQTFDILRWWSDKCNTYKVLALMAKDILAIPVSTVASESTFSTSGRVVDEFRSNLLPKTVEALVCTQDWLRSTNVSIDLEQLLEDVQKYEEELKRNMDDISGGNK